MRLKRFLNPRLRLLGLLFGLLALSATAKAAGEDAPSWLKEAAAASTPAYEKDVPAVVLVDDGTISISDDGRVSKVYNFAVRVLRREGRAFAVASVGYIPETSKVKELRAWIIRSNGDVRRYGKDDSLDLAGAPNDVYDEYRIKKISAVDDADAGVVFGYTYTTEEHSVFSQDEWAFQSSIPVISSHYTLSLPAGWRAAGVVFNHSKIEPTVNGTTYSWELRNLEAIPKEPL